MVVNFILIYWFEKKKNFRNGGFGGQQVIVDFDKDRIIVVHA